MKNIQVLIATHKDYEFPVADYYFPIQVGKENKDLDLPIQGDNQGQNISAKNKSFCELTALYWAWKNLDNVDMIGLVHYRRYFSGKELNFKGEFILSEQEILSDLSSNEIILPKKRNYYIESVYQHYKNAHFIKDLDLTRQIVEKRYPDYLDAFDKVMKGKKLHLFNMFVMPKLQFDLYCEWLFSILFELEKYIDISDYDNYQKRVFGFLAERLFNVWVVKNQLKVKERKVISLEGDAWFKKAIGLLKRKFLNKR